MQILDEDLQDQDLPARAVAALTAASRHAGELGRTVVVLLDGALVQQSPSGAVTLKKIAPRLKVESRIKKAQS